MLDLQHLPRSTRADVQIFALAPAVALTDWVTWRKPRGVSMIYMFGVNSGGGGGGGNTNNGGCGGGSGAQAALLIPAFCVPDVLYLQLGLGGAAGAANGAGGQGQVTYVCVYPNTAQVNRMFSPNSLSVANGGAAAGGSGGTGGPLGTIASMPLGGYGLMSFAAGQNGQDGSGAAPATMDLRSDGGLVMGGMGGSGATGAPLAGPGLTAIASSFLSESAPAAAAIASSAGGGFALLAPFYVYPGMGAPSVTSATGVNGGDGVYGGGGGGGGSAATTGGKGGKGGNGFVIIISW